MKSLHGLSSVDVFVKGVGLGRDAAIRAMGAFEITVDSIKDVTGVPHGGVRPRKARRA
ncbi:30S ribosomal protein S11 [compost metagenome]